MVELQRINIARVSIEKDTTQPTAKPSKIIQEFITEHKRLKSIIDRYAAKRTCIPLNSLEKESRVAPATLKQHTDLFREHDYISQATDDTICSRKALSHLKKKLEEAL